MHPKVKDFRLAISASDLVNWTGPRDEDCIGNPYLVNALNLIDIAIDPVALFDKFHLNGQSGIGDVHLYHNHKKSPSYFVIDMYRGLDDQHDVIQIGVRAEDNPQQVKIALRSFIDTVGGQYLYEEANTLHKLNDLLDVDSYPKEINESGYKQRIFICKLPSF